MTNRYEQKTETIKVRVEPATKYKLQALADHCESNGLSWLEVLSEATTSRSRGEVAPAGSDSGS